MSWRHQMPKHETRNTFYWITWEVRQSGDEICPAYNIRKENFLSKKSMKNMAWKLVPGPF